MRTRLFAWWDALRSSYWFVPALMTLGGVALSIGMTRLDESLARSNGLIHEFASTPEGARSMLSTLAGAQITLAGLSFSITIVALTVASQQFGSRLLRNFMRDLGNQIVLGTFVASFVYSVLVQVQIRGGDESTWVPSLSLGVAIAMALASLGVLIYFIHHVAASIQASELIAVVGAEIDAAIDTLFPEEAGNEAHARDREDPAAESPGEGGTDVLADRVGYVQAIDLDGLMAIARKRDVMIRLACRPGDRVVRSCPVATVWPEASDEVSRAVNRALILGVHRTSVQDLEFSIDQLVEVAVRALSPGINDPFTAMTCIDRLSASLCLLARRDIPSPVRRDDDGKPRVLARPWSFPGALDAACDQIRQYGRGSASVSIRLIEGLSLVARQVWRRRDRAAVRRQVEMIGRSAAELPEANDRDALLRRTEDVLRTLASDPSPTSAAAPVRSG